MFDSIDANDFYWSYNSWVIANQFFNNIIISSYKTHCKFNKLTYRVRLVYISSHESFSNRRRFLSIWQYKINIFSLQCIWRETAHPIPRVSIQTIWLIAFDKPIFFWKHRSAKTPTNRILYYVSLKIHWFSC